VPQQRDRSIFARLLVLLLALALVAAACSSDDGDDEAGGEESGSESSEAPSGGELIDLQNFAFGEPDHIDPGLAAVLQGAQIGQLLFDTLTEFDFSDRENPVLKGQVASEWETEDEGKTWVFTLKDDVVFSDGSPVTPSSFKGAWELHASAEYASEIAYHFASIEGAAAVTDGEATEISGVVADDDAGTLTVTLTDKLAEFPAIVSHPVFSPKTEEGIAAGAGYEQEVMVGNGPFKMAEPWQHEESITLERNEEWNGGIYGDGELAKLDRIEFRISRDVDSAFADFEAGNGNTGFIPSGRYADATAAYGHATDASLGVYHFFVNQEDPQVGGPENLKLRQAISLAIDRDAINDAAYDGARRNATGITPPGVPGYEEGLCGDFCELDPDRAKELFAEWEADGGTITGPITVNFNSGSGHEDIVAIVQANLRETLGIEVRLDGREPTTYFSEMREGACGICRAGWIWDYPSYDSAAYALFHSSGIGGDNLARYSNPEVDDLLDRARATTDDEDRYDLYRQAEEQGLADMAIIPINWYAGQIVYDDSVQNLIYTPLQFVLYEQVTVEG
jgi:oligopeptide transport system substrate-binding protein